MVVPCAIINAAKDVGRKVWLCVSVYFCVSLWMWQGCHWCHTTYRRKAIKWSTNRHASVWVCLCVCASTTPPLSYFLSLVPCMVPSNCCTPLSHLSMTHVCMCLIVSPCVVTRCAVEVLPGACVLICSSFQQNLTGLCAPDINTCTHTDAQVDE